MNRPKGCQAKIPAECYRHGVPLHKKYVSETDDVEVYLQKKEKENLHRRKTTGNLTALKDMNAQELEDELRTTTENEDWINSEDIEESIELASILHAHQKRSNRGNFKNTPYIEHPLRNSVRLMRLGCKDRDVIIAAVLHDTLEDGAQQYLAKIRGTQQLEELQAREELSKHIQTRYQARVLNLVQAVTNDYITDKDKATMSTAHKNRIYLNHVKNSIRNNPGVLLVKISDFIDNATGLHHNNTPERRQKTLKQAQKYLPVIDVFLNELTTTKLPIPDSSQKKLIRDMEITRNRLSAIIKGNTEK